MLDEEFYWVFGPLPKAIDGKDFFESMICLVRATKILPIKCASIYQIDILFSVYILLNIFLVPIM